MGDGTGGPVARDWTRLLRPIRPSQRTHSMGYPTLSADSGGSVQVVWCLHRILSLGDIGVRLSVECVGGSGDVGDCGALLQSQCGGMVGMALGAVSGSHAVRCEVGMGSFAHRVSLRMHFRLVLTHARDRRRGPTRSTTKSLALGVFWGLVGAGGAQQRIYRGLPAILRFMGRWRFLGPEAANSGSLAGRCGLFVLHPAVGGSQCNCVSSLHPHAYELWSRTVGGQRARWERDRDRKSGSSGKGGGLVRSDGRIQLLPLERSDGFGAHPRKSGRLPFTLSASFLLLLGGFAAYVCTWTSLDRICSESEFSVHQHRWCAGADSCPASACSWRHTIRDVVRGHPFSLLLHLCSGAFSASTGAVDRDSWRLSFSGGGEELAGAVVSTGTPIIHAGERGRIARPIQCRAGD